MEGAEGQDVGVEGWAVFEVEGEGVRVIVGEGGGGTQETQNVSASVEGGRSEGGGRGGGGGRRVAHVWLGKLWLQDATALLLFA